MSYGPPPPGNPGPPPPPPPGGGYGPPSGGYGPPSGGYGGYGGYGGVQQPPSAEPPKNYLWFNILGIISCAWVLGVIGLVFALQVNSKWQMGDYAGAESSANVAKILGIIAFVCFCLSWAYVIFMITIGFVGAASGW